MKSKKDEFVIKGIPIEFIHELIHNVEMPLTSDTKKPCSICADTLKMLRVQVDAEFKKRGWV